MQIFDDNKHSDFAIFHLIESKKLLELLENRKLQPRDFAVLFAIMTQCNAKTGEIRFMVKTLSQQINMNSTSFSNSLKRLKDNFLIVTVTNHSGDKFYLINPYFFSVGRRQKWGHLLNMFAAAVN
jgi:hypothetical protein